MIFFLGCKGARGTEFAYKDRNFFTSARFLNDVDVETGTAELDVMPLSQCCTSQPSARLSGHCRENLLSWSSANDGAKLLQNFLKTMPHCGVSCRGGGLTPLSKRQSGNLNRKGHVPVLCNLPWLSVASQHYWKSPLGITTMSVGWEIKKVLVRLEAL